MKYFSFLILFLGIICVGCTKNDPPINGTSTECIKNNSLKITDFKLLDYTPPISAKINQYTNTLLFGVPDNSFNLLSLKIDYTTSGGVDSSVPLTNKRISVINDPFVALYGANKTCNQYTIRYRNIINSMPSNKLNYVIATSTDGSLYCFDAALSGYNWRQKFADDDFSGTPTSDGLNIFARGRKKIYSLDKNTGDKKWEFKFPTSSYSYSSIPSLIGTSLIFVKGHDVVYCLNKIDGSIKWEYKIDESKFELYSNTSVNNDIVLVTGKDLITEKYKLICLDLSNGTKKWEFTSDHQMYSSPVLYQNSAIVSTSWKNLYSINLTNGSKNWEYIENTNYPNFSPGVTYGDNIIIGCSNELISFKISNGNINWSKTLGTYVNVAPALFTGKIFLNKSYGVYSTTGSYKYSILCINPDNGATIWSKQNNGNDGVGPVVCENVIFNIDDLGSFNASSAIDGTLFWKSNIHITTEPCLINSDNSVILPTISGNVQ